MEAEFVLFRVTYPLPPSELMARSVGIKGLVDVNIPILKDFVLCTPALGWHTKFRLGMVTFTIQLLCKS